MSNSSINGSDQDYVFINTNVKIGKSFKSRGWALTKKDINDWIPADKFEKKCQVVINNISADAILRFNPRLFYKSDELSYYLKELYDKGLSNEKIPMKIKVNKDTFYSEDDVMDYSPKSIDTMLRVGKSYSSGGWQLSKDVVSLLFPVEKYDAEYLIYIDEICSNAKLNLQFRLFYKSEKLSGYLEELYYEDYMAKIPAKIIFESDSDDKEVIEKEVISKNSINNKEELHSCSECGKDYILNDNSFNSDDKFKTLCSECIEKITALNAYNSIKKSSLSNFIKKSHVADRFDSNFDELWGLLIKYDFLSPIGDLYKLNGNDSIEKNYSKFLSDIDTNSKLFDKKRKLEKFSEHIIEENISEDSCVVCGNILKSTEVGKCAECADKSLATEYLRNIVTKVPYGKTFSKNVVMDVCANNVEVDLFIDKLLKYYLIRKINNSYKLANVSILNMFIEKYSNHPYKLQINYINDNSDILKISKKDLDSEESIDSRINWMKYRDSVSFKKGQYDFIFVKFKQNGNFMYSKKYRTSYEAKLEATRYLNAIGELELISDEDIKLEFK